MNPYQSPNCFGDDVAELSSAHRGGASILFALGQFAICLASLLIVVRCCIELDLQELQQLDSLPQAAVGGVVGILALMLASWVSIALFGYVRRHAARSRSTYCYTMILIATASIFIRGILEPASVWTPTWPNYLLTGSAVVALLLLRRQLAPSTSV